MADNDDRPEYAEDIDGLDALPDDVQRYLAEQRAFWRQVRGDDGPSPR